MWLFSVNSHMHLKNIVEFCIVFGAAQLENVIGVVNLPPGARTFQPYVADKFVGTLNSSTAQRITLSDYEALLPWNIDRVKVMLAGLGGG